MQTSLPSPQATPSISHQDINRRPLVIVVGPAPPLKNDGGVQQLFLRTPADGIPI